MSESTEKIMQPLPVATVETPGVEAATLPDSISNEADLPPMDEAVVEEQPASVWSLVRELLETIVLSLVIFLVIRQGVQNYRIESHSMEPTFYDSQFVLVNKLAYKFGEPERGDVIVFRNPANEDEDYIKRVIGLPGDTIEFGNGDVYVDGKLIDSSFTDKPTYSSDAVPILVGPDSLFVMGDNRTNSRDSRDFGELDEDLVVGKAWLRVWPVSEFGLIDHPDLGPGVPLSAEPLNGD